MSQAMLVRRQLALGASSRKSCRAGAVVRAPKPFTPARKVFISRAQPEDAEDAAADAEMLMEGESSDADDYVSETLEALVLDVDEDEDDNDDEADLRAAIKVAEEYTSSYADHLILEASLREDLKAVADGVDEVEGLEEPDAADVGDSVAEEEDEGELKMAAAAAELAFESLLVSASNEDDEETIMAFAGSAAADAEDVHDAQGPQGFRKYDEQEDVGITLEERAEMSEAKLTKQELASLVPEDWDTINVDWFSSKQQDNIPLPEYKLNFIWTERNIAVSVDQVYARGQVSPLTEYFFWPRNDAWDELRRSLEARPWIPERDRVILLNRTTEVINTWQVELENRPSLELVRVGFPDCSFMGTSSPAFPPPLAAYDSELAAPPPDVYDNIYDAQAPMSA